MPMFEISKYFLPSACFLLITVFFMLLPDLRSCRLDGGERRMEGTDMIIIAAITLVYATAAFLGLGNPDSPQSFVPMENETAELALDSNSGETAKLMVYTGVGIGSYSIDYIGADGRSLHLSDMEQSHADVLKWRELVLETPVTGGTLRISGRGGVWLGEVVALTADGKKIPLTSNLPELADEHELCPTRQTFMNSSDFDEIYHARTAWEQLNAV